jgi:hypothetical protein
MPTVDWPWAIILARLSDVPAVPQPPDYYADLFTRDGTGGVCDYWRAVSNNSLDITGSRVLGWFDVGHTTAEYNTLVTQLFSGSRGPVIQWGIDAARANGANMTGLRNVLVLLNWKPTAHDHGASGGNVLILHQDPTVCEFGFICHEMGHGFLGGGHSNSANPDTVYGDGWDLMSFATTTFQFPITFRGSTGVATVGLNARNVEALGVLPAGRTWTPPAPDFSVSLTLDPLNQPAIGNHGHLVAKIPPNGTRPGRANGSLYTVEFRRRQGWDQQIPEDAVLIHEVRTNTLSYLQPAMWRRYVSGEQFTSVDPVFCVRVGAIDGVAGTAAIRVWDMPEGCLRKEDSKPRVYLIESGRKRWVTTPQVLSALGKTWADVRSVPDGGLMNVPDGPDVNLLTATVDPYPVPLDQAVAVTVRARDVSSGADVAGSVIVDGATVGQTGTPFTHTYRPRRRRVSVRPPEWEITYPAGRVTAPGYPDVQLDFGFRDL